MNIKTSNPTVVVVVNLSRAWLIHASYKQPIENSPLAKVNLHILVWCLHKYGIFSTFDIDSNVLIRVLKFINRHVTT